MHSNADFIYTDKIIIYLHSLIPNEVTAIFNWPNPSSRNMALGLTQPLTEKSTRNLPGGEEWPAHKGDNLTAICEPTV
jgi:hypothetical protein